MFSTSSRQCNIPKVLILVTDGNSNGLPPLEPEAEKVSSYFDVPKTKCCIYNFVN